MLLRRLTYSTLTALALLGCNLTDTKDDKPATPIAVDDAAMQVAVEICEQALACGCSTTEGYADEAECVSTIEAEFQATIDEILAIGGSWNAECAGELVKAMNQWDCLGPTGAVNTSSFNTRVCPVLKGGLAEGDECNTTTFGDECEPGLACLSGVCIQQPSLPVAVGGTCEFDWEQLPCEAGSWCTYEPQADTAVCVALPKLGDACSPNEDSLCGPPGNDLICSPDTSTCIAAPGAGEPCFNEFLCGPGNYCDGGQDFTCQPRRELGEGCAADAVCPVDASCISNVCEADEGLVCNAVYWF